MTKIKEIWKDIPEYRGYYKISNLGNVFSFISGKKLALCANGRGYVIIILTRPDIKKKTFLVHRLVAKLFVPNPYNLPQVNHKKGIKIDNRASELEWTNQSGNQIHAYKIGLQSPSLKQKISAANHNKTNYSKKVLQFDLEGDFISEYYSASEAARKTGAKQPAICRVCRGELNKHHNYVWKYT
jgi:hypothetical protein